MALHAKAKAGADYRFYALYDKISREDILSHAYAQRRSNKGTPGIDGVVLDDASLRWAAAESVSETVIAAICLLETRSVDEIVATLTPAELEQVHQDRRAESERLSSRSIRGPQGSPTHAVTEAAAW